MININIDTSGYKPIRIKLSKDMLFTVARLMVGRYFNRMKSGLGITASGSLAPHKSLSRKYKKRPSGKKPTPPPLIDTGRMASSLRAIWNESTSTKAIIAVRSFKHPFSKLKTPALAAIHHFGSAKINLPARPHIGFSKEDEREAFRKYSKLLKESLGL